MKNKLYIMCGIPGSGKSTYAKTYLTNTLYVSRDEIRFKLVKEDEDYFSKENEVFDTFIAKINEGLRQSLDVVADATHLNSKSRLKLLACLELDKTKTEVIVIVMNTPLSICLEHNENRKGTRSYVPREVIKKMSYAFRIPNYEECCGLIDTIKIIMPGGV